ncbi:MAG: CsbD family protein [Actinomycetes bacterium]
MGWMDKLRNTALKLRGRTKQRTGEATGDPVLRSEGRADQGEAGLKQAGEHLKDTGRDIKGTFDK